MHPARYNGRCSSAHDDTPMKHPEQQMLCALLLTTRFPRVALLLLLLLAALAVLTCTR
jgi:hypothetical protein